MMVFRVRPSSLKPGETIHDAHLFGSAATKKSTTKKKKKKQSFAHGAPPNSSHPTPSNDSSHPEQRSTTADAAADAPGTSLDQLRSSGSYTGRWRRDKFDSGQSENEFAKEPEQEQERQKPEKDSSITDGNVLALDESRLCG